MRTATLLTVLALSAAANASPETRSGQAPAYPVQPQEGPSRELASYRIAPEQFTIQFGEVKQKRTYSVRDAAFPSPVKQRWATIHGSYYKPARLRPGQKVPAAVVVHHLGGDFGAEAFLAQHLAQHGVAAFFISLPNYGKRQEKGTKQGFMRLDPQVAFATFRQAALDVIRAGDFLRSLPEVDPERVGVVGVSLGAFVSALARGVDPRLTRSVLILGGGDLARTFSQLPEAKEVLDKVGINAQMLAPILKPIDPITFASRVRTDDVLMFGALRDEIVPRASTDALWKALGKPQIRWYDCGHYGIVLHVLKVMNLTLDHIKGEDVR